MKLVIKVGYTCIIVDGSHAGQAMSLMAGAQVCESSYSSDEYKPDLKTEIEFKLVPDDKILSVEVAEQKNIEQLEKTTAEANSARYKAERELTELKKKLAELQPTTGAPK